MNLLIRFKRPQDDPKADAWLRHVMTMLNDEVNENHDRYMKFAERCVVAHMKYGPAWPQMN